MRTLCVVRIALVTRFDPWTPEAWPRMCQGYCGTAHWLLRELPRQGITVDAIGPLRECRSALWYLRGLWRAWRWRALYEGWAEPGLALSYASQVREQLRVGNYDVVLCPDNAMPIAFLENAPPIVLYTDALWGSLVDFYPWLTGRPQRMLRDIATMEQMALNRCHTCIFASQWAADRARELYAIDRTIAVIPLGGHMQCRWGAEEVESMVRRRPHSPWNLLFIGHDGWRKGVDRAIQSIQELRSRGHAATLTILGTDQSALPPLPPGVRALGYVSYEQKKRELWQAHLLLHPARAETFGTVICEANAHGVPVIATAVGGIPTIIREHRNGMLLHPDASPGMFADAIAAILHNRSTYEQLARTAFAEYCSRLSWPVATRKLLDVMREVTAAAPFVFAR